MASLYYYTARSAGGVLTRGSIQASSEAAALATLRTRALFVTSLKDTATVEGSLAAAVYGGNLPHHHLVALFRSLATLVGAGVPLRRSLEVTLEQCSAARLRDALSSVIADIEGGLPLSYAMERRPREFPRLFVAMVRAGESGGVLDVVLERLAVTLERERGVRKRLAATLAYPAVVAVSALALIIFLITMVVPTFQSLYEQMRVPVPRITSALLIIGTFLRQPECWLGATLLVIACAVVLLRLRLSKNGGNRLEALLMRMPLAGSIVRKSTLARVSRLFGVLLRSGVGVVEALDTVRDATTNSAYRDSLSDMRIALGNGSSIAATLSHDGLYEPMFVQMVRVGEETGALDAMLLRIADYYDLDVETALNALGSTLEPCMILVLGGAVGFIVAAVFIPLYSLIGSIK